MCPGQLAPTNAWQAARYTIPGLTAHKCAMEGGMTADVPDLGDPPAELKVFCADREKMKWITYKLCLVRQRISPPKDNKSQASKPYTSLKKRAAKRFDFAARLFLILNFICACFFKLVTIVPKYVTIMTLN